MAFAVEDFQDLMTLLRANPEWLAELRHLLIDEFWQPLRDDVQRLTDAVEASRVESDRRWAENALRWEESDRRWEESDRRWEANERRWEESDRRWEETKRTFGEHTRLLTEHSGMLRSLDTRTGHLEGYALESRVRANGAGIFGRVLKRSRVVIPGNLAPLLAAVEGGVITEAEWDQLMSLDLLLSGRRDDREVLVAVEVSVTIDGGDVTRAIDRAGLLQRAGYEAIPAVAGNRITDAARRRAAVAEVLVQLVA